MDPVSKLRGFPVHKFKPSSFDAIKSPTVVARSALQSPTFNLLDICSGSGNIGLSVASQFPLANVLGADLDERAVRLARENGTVNGVLNAYFTHCDVFADHRAAPAAAAACSEIAPAASTEPAAAPAAPQGLFDLQVRTENKNFYTSTLTTRESPQVERSSARSLLFDVLVSNPPYVTAAEHEGLQPEVRNWENRDALVPNVPAAARRQVASHASSLSASVHWPTVAEVDALALHFYERIIWCSPRLLRPIDELWLLNRMSTPVPTFTHSANTAMGNANAEAAAAAAPPLMATVERAVLSQVPRVVLEVGQEAQAVPVAEMLKAQGFRPEVFLDAGENVRWIVGFHR
jgi:methylase of polypeptide subunit release factors